MAKYRKKPVVIDAWPIREILHNAANNWASLPQPVRDAYEDHKFVFTHNAMFIKTLEGEHEGSINDMLLMGIAGEFYPCKPDIFASTYEEVGEENA